MSRGRARDVPRRGAGDGNDPSAGAVDRARRRSSWSRLAVVLWPSGGQSTRRAPHDLETAAQVPRVRGPVGGRQQGADVARDPGRHQAARSRPGRATTRSARRTSTSTASRSCSRRRARARSLIVWVLPVVVLALGCHRHRVRAAAQPSASRTSHATDGRRAARASASTDARTPATATQLDPDDRRRARGRARLPAAVARRPRARARRAAASTTSRTSELHDDYTARAAAVIRALRDGVDARPAPAAASPARRAAGLVVAGVVVFAVLAGVSLALRARRPPPRADVVGQLGGRADDDERGGQRAASSGSRRSRRRSTPARRLRPAARRSSVRLRGERRPRQCAQAVRRRHRDRRRTGPRRTPTPAGSLYLASESGPDKDTQKQLVAAGARRVQPGDRTSIPNYADALLLPGGAVLAAQRVGPSAGPISRTTWCRRRTARARAGARRCSPRHRRRSKRRRLRVPPTTTTLRRTRRGAAHGANPPRTRSTSARSTGRRSPPTAARSSLDLDPKLAPQDREQLRRARPSGLLRRSHVPPCRARVRDPGRRPRGQRERRSRLQVRGRAGAGRVHARRRGDGERRARTPTARSSSCASTTAPASSTKDYNLFGYVVDGIDVAQATQVGDVMQTRHDRRDATRS